MDAFIEFTETLDPHELFLLRVAMTAALVVLAVFGTRLIRRMFGVVERILEPFAPHWLRILVNGFSEPLNLLMRAVLLYCAFLTMPTPLISTETLWSIITPFLRAAAIVLISWGLWRSAPICQLLLRTAENQLDMQANRTMGHFIENIYRVIVAVSCVLVVLDCFGVPVASLVAGAGIAGLALSLAAQSTLSNLIAGITLVLEHPFGIGDYIILGEYEGTVEDISFRSTRLRTPDKVVIWIENSKVCSEYIQNGNMRDSRLWSFNLRLPYDTPYPTLESFMTDLRAHLMENPLLRKDTMVITVDSIGEDGIKILLRLYSSTSDYIAYLQTRDRINREIMILLEKHGCRLAYPSTDVYLPHADPVKAHSGAPGPQEDTPAPHR